jgi:1,4-alpha-glucan branching enzyme
LKTRQKKKGSHAVMSVKKKETFEINDPNATSVELVGDFTAWDQKPVSLKRQKDGTWRATVSLDPGTHEYRFRVDGQWRDDTSCSARRPNPFGSDNCIRDVSP